MRNTHPNLNKTADVRGEHDRLLSDMLDRVLELSRAQVPDLAFAAARLAMVYANAYRIFGEHLDGTVEFGEYAGVMVALARMLREIESQGHSLDPRSVREAASILGLEIALLQE
ncbi:MAG: hypothetical protein LC808_24115 [Actinobacteria bacterium]|nr:hypothetical protein [Actinomycetota bacterium]